jgi:chromosome segregation ATPase
MATIEERVARLEEQFTNINNNFKDIKDSLNKINGKIDIRYAQNGKQDVSLGQLETRISIIERAQSNFVKGLWALLVAVAGSYIQWLLKLL